MFPSQSHQLTTCIFIFSGINFGVWRLAGKFRGISATALALLAVVDLVCFALCGDIGIMATTISALFLRPALFAIWKSPQQAASLQDGRP